MEKNSIYFPGLNGLRAIAALGVVISHLTMQLDKFNLHFHIFGSRPDGSPKGYLLATYGVTIFFVLSGFLITYLLQVEKDKQPINIKNFYLRRVLRIWPLYYFYFFLCLVFIAIYALGFNLTSFFLYTFMCANIAGLLKISLPLLDHYWSIGVEEQFYLFWPFLIRKIKDKLVPLLFALIILQLGLRVIVWFFWPYSFLANLSILMRFDCMMIGGLGAIFYKANNIQFMKIVDNKFTQLICFLILGLLICNKFHINAVVDTFIISLMSVGLIVGQINIKNRLISLDTKVFDFLGKISYGIYIYHLLIIFLAHKFIFRITDDSFLNYVFVYLGIIALTILTAYISYEYFEKRFIKLKSRYTAVESSNSRT